MRYIRSFWFSTNYDLSVTILPAWAEDRATVGTRPERRPRGQYRSGVSFAVPRWFNSMQKQLRDWHNAINPQQKYSPSLFLVLITPVTRALLLTYRADLTHRFPGGAIFSICSQRSAF